ncbi:V-type ATP synthase subunit I domain-containing protein [Priestia filamentosa]|uniref:hypothetical protein n=1 Tax=Priestia filamentosa TaxID=1402861 RepID=UPI003982064B
MRRILFSLLLMFTLINHPFLSYAETTGTTKEAEQSETDQPTEEVKQAQTTPNQTQTDNDTVSQKDLYETLLKSKEEKISLLQGNISSVLTAIGVILAVLTIIFAAFGFWLRNEFGDKHQNVKDIKNELENKLSKVTDLESELKTTKRELEDMRHILRKKEEEFFQKFNWIDSTSNFLSYLEVKDQRLLNSLKILYLKPKAEEMIEYMHEVLKLDFSSYETEETAVERVTAKFRGQPDNIKSDKEKMQEQLEEIKNNLAQEENNIQDQLKIKLQFVDVLETDSSGKETMNYNDELEDICKSWVHEYNRLAKLFIKFKKADAHINSMNEE